MNFAKVQKKIILLAQISFFILTFAVDMYRVEIPSKKNIIFLSDFHLGSPNYRISLEREKKIVDFFLNNTSNTQAIFLLGDIFDFWFEYKYVCPKGFTRFLGSLANLVDKGVDIHYFTGNHDFAAGKYLQQEIGLKIYKQQELFTINEKLFLVGHGDGLDTNEKMYKFMKKKFNNKINQKIFGMLHPKHAFALANYLSNFSRKHHSEELFQIKNNNLIDYCKNMLVNNPDINYFIYGHRHYPSCIPLNDKSTYINTGDWLQNDSYAIFENGYVRVEKFQPPINLKSNL